MSGPWNKFKPATAEAGPWSKFKKPDAPAEQSVTGRGILQGTLDALPAAGGMFGGAVGFASPVPGGALMGAGLGGAGGAALKSILESALLDKEKSYSDVAKAPVMGALEGLSGEMGGQVIGKILSSIPKASLKPNAPKIEAAAQRLDIKPTQGMLTEGPVIPGLENSLSQSPSLSGGLVRREQAPVEKAVKEGVESLVSGRSSLSPYEAGSQIKTGLVQKIGEELGPIQMIYDDVADATQHMGLNPKSQERIARNMRSIEDVVLLPNSTGAKLANELATGVENAKNVKQLGLLSSKAKAMMRDPTVPVVDKDVAAKLINRIDQLQDNSIMRNAIEASRSKQSGDKVGKDIVGSLKEAGREYKKFIQKYQSLGAGSKITTGKYGASNIIREIESVPSEKVAEKLFTNQNNDFLNFLKDGFPEQYAVAREQKLTQIFKNSEAPDGTVSPKKFFSAIKNLGPEVRTHLFGKNANIDDLQTIIQSIPQKVGASDTPRGLDFQNLMNPILQGRDALRYGALKTLPKTEQIKGKLQGPMSRGLIRFGTSRAVDNEQ